MTVVAVIACLDPPDTLVASTRETLRQADHVIAVDDGSRMPTTVFADLEALGVEVVHQANGGVAAALNAGIEIVLTRARGAGATYVLTLDQDSTLAHGYVEAALATVRRLDAGGIPFSLVSAASYRGRSSPHMGVVAGERRAGGVPPLRWAFDPMQSGWLVPVTTFEAVGLLEDDLVIDGVDSEFTARCRDAGLAPVVALGAHLDHGQGERTAGRVLGRDVGMVNRHSPTRVRYMSRNGTLITRRYLATQPRWVLRRLGEETKAHLLRLALDPERSALARAVVSGWVDGLRGRTGRLPG